MNPQRTIKILNDLKKNGFTNAAFCRLHHFRASGRKVTINAHKQYCATRSSFVNDGNNELVQQRLELVWDAYRKGGFKSSNSKVFIALAEAAFYELPPK